MAGLPEKLAFVDVETTGSNPRGDRVMEIGIVRVENRKVVSTLDTLVNPLTPPPEFIVTMTGINPFDLHEAPLFSEIIYDVQEHLEDAVFVAHNARFDYAFVKNEFMRHDMSFNSKVLCTVKLARKLYPRMRRYNLDNLIRRFGLENIARHRAFGDAYSIWDFYSKNYANGKRDEMEVAVSELLKNPSLPPNISKNVIDKLPEGPGVYIFNGEAASSAYGESDGEKSVLYVGKSVNIRDRVKSHFSSDYASSKDLNIKKYLTDIEYIETSGELGALIKEASLIKELMPIFNRRLRRNQDMVVAMEVENNGYKSVRLERLRHVSMDMVESVLGVYRSFKQSKESLYRVCEENMLCPKIMGLEKGKGACFNYQLEKCSGACVGDESSVEYNLRFMEAFSKHKVPLWPFDGAISITENTFKTSETHFVDKWCYFGSIKIDSEGNENTKLEEVRFDWDTFQILKKFVLKRRSDVSIKPITNEEIKALKTN